VIKDEKMGQSQENNNGTKITEKKKRETSAEKKAMISEDVALGDIASDKIFEADPELAKELEEDRKIQARALEYKEKKLQRAKKRKKRLIISLVIIVILSASGFLGYKYYQQKKAAENSEAIVAVSDGQELVYASVTLVAGNNITVDILQETTSSAEESAETTDMKSSGMKAGRSDSGSSYTETGESTQYQIPVGTVVITKLGTSATFSSISTGNVLAIALEEGTDIIDKVWIIE
jgi:cytoskeletal protein RodZ